MNYCTVEECNDYVATHYAYDDPVRERWEMADEEDQQIFLTKAHEILEALPFTGRKTCVSQPNAFPRYPDNYVPQEVKNAECEQALTFSDPEESQKFDDYRKMIQYGIQSYSIGNFSETLLSYSKNGVEMQYGLSSEAAKRWLTPWLSGGYRIG